MKVESRDCKMEKLNSQPLMKVMVFYLTYFLYTYVAGMVVSGLAISNSALVMFPADFLFLLFAIYMYKENLRRDFRTLKKKKKGKVVGAVLLGVLVVFIGNIVMGAMTDILFPNAPLDNNTQALQSMLATAPLYVIFKTLIFATVAEEILFRESIFDCVKNPVFFVLVSAIVYTAMNFIFSGTGISVLNVLIYFVPALLLSAIYIKNDSNIIIIMFIKFVLQFIPFIALLATR